MFGVPYPGVLPHGRPIRIFLIQPLSLVTGARSDREAAVENLRNAAAVGKVGKEFIRFSNLAAINGRALKITVEYSCFY